MLAKKIFYNPLIKTAMFIMIVVLLSNSLLQTLVTFDKISNPETLINSNFISSDELKDKITKELDSIIHTLTTLRSEEYIKNGNTIPDTYNYDSNLISLYNEFISDLRNEDQDKFYDYSKEELYIKFVNSYSQDVKEAEQRLIKRHLDSFNSNIDRLKNLNGFEFYFTLFGKEYLNKKQLNKEYVLKQPVYLYYEKGKLETNLNFNQYEKSYYNYKYDFNDNDVMYIAIDSSFYAKELNNWNDNRLLVTGLYKSILWKLLVALTLIVYLLLVSGKRYYDDVIHLNIYDRIFFEIQVIATITAIPLFADIVFYNSGFSSNLDFMIILLFGGIIFTLGLGLLLSFTKHIKNKTFFKYVFTTLAITATLKFFRNVYRSFPTALRMLPTPSNAINLKRILYGVKSIKKGEVDHVIRYIPKGIYAELADNINNISLGLKSAIDSELKSERLKTELITNVSHDIRTPLTSIITYIDLLKNEGLESENKDKYLEVIESKANRLKNLTDDLFEASKASTGNIPVNLETIDLVSLINQGMAELEDKIEDCGLNLRIKHPSEKCFVKADGKLLWRVIENLMSNIFKYAMPNSRVYIDITNNRHTIQLTIKNISKYELNVNGTDLMERFTRGEQSRTSEGSGLGLNIAKSLIELQNGKFSIEIDGDLFKVNVNLIKALAPTKVDNPVITDDNSNK